MWEKDVEGEESFPVSVGIEITIKGCEFKSITTQLLYHTHTNTHTKHTHTHNFYVVITQGYKTKELLN